MLEDPLAKAALDHISTTARRWTPEALVTALSREYRSDRRSVRKAINRLIQTGAVQYTYEFGCSFLVPSMNRPVAVSTRVVLSPPDFPLRLTGKQVGILLSHGAAFGTGSHPTTRLAVRAIDHALSSLPEDWLTQDSRALDVGTGSGVLLLAAIKLGVPSGVGIDLDPCAVSEARTNAALNGLATRAVFSDRSLSDCRGPFRFITANLRMPTLLDMAPVFTGLADSDAGLVISGLREDESAVVRRRYHRTGWHMIWEEMDTGWAGQAYLRLPR